MLRPAAPMLVALALSACATTPTAGPASAQSAEQAAVERVVAGLFDAMREKNGTAIDALLDPQARLVAVTDGGVKLLTRAQFKTAIVESQELLLERCWDAEIRIAGPIASVWTPYDFHRDGAFSHCGTDSFQLVRRAVGWQVTSIVYTRVKQGCQPSPLGPVSTPSG